MKIKFSMLLSIVIMSTMIFSPASQARKTKKHRTDATKMIDNPVQYSSVRYVTDEEMDAEHQETHEEAVKKREQKLLRVAEALNRKEARLKQEMREMQVDKQLDQFEAELAQRDDKLQALEEKVHPQTYAARMGWKALDGYANINTAILEVPKSIIQTTNESNIVFGLVGGTAKGILNTLGRVATGVTDLVTFPIATKKIISPGHVWEDFDAETTYGQTFRLDNTPTTRFEKIQKCDIVGPAC
jgi:putative exosortase-associated protein (TIGR04073 family)